MFVLKLYYNPEIEIPPNIIIPKDMAIFEGDSNPQRFRMVSLSLCSDTVSGRVWLEMWESWFYIAGGE